MTRSLTLVFALLLGSACEREETAEVPPHERALRIWETNLKAAERLIEAKDAGPELQRLSDFFRRLTGGSGLLIAHTYDNITVSPQALSAINRLNEWCAENCDRLTIDPETDKVVLAPE